MVNHPNRSKNRAAVPVAATDLLAAYCEAAAILSWLVDHNGECLGDNPLALAKAKAALAKIHAR